jgi:heterodisulfide reductase subunit B
MGITSLTSPCSSCFARLKASEQAVRDDETTARTVEADTGHAYQGTVTVSHLLDTLLERAGLAKIRARVKKPLSGLKLACYYGCLITRPAKVTGDAHAEYPTKMDDLMRGLGAEPIEWSSKTACCGNSLSLTRPEIAHDLSAKIIREARDCGADAVVTMCPMCHFNLDARQPDIGLEEETPILHATQLMLLAFGESAKAAQLAKNMVDPTTLLKQRGIIGR